MPKNYYATMANVTVQKVALNVISWINNKFSAKFVKSFTF